MLQLMAKVEQAVVPFFVTLSYKEEAKREQSRALLDQDPGMFFLYSLRQWVARHWYDVVGSKSFSHYRAGTRVEKLRTTKGAFAYAAKRYVAKKEEMSELENKPGRFWGVVGRKNLPFGKREDREVTASQAVKLRRVMRRYRVANTPPEKRKYLRKSQLWSEDFTAKLICNVEFWLECLPKLIEIKLAFKRPVAAGADPLPRPRQSD